MTFDMMHGDSYAVRFHIYNKDGDIVPSMVDDVEICLGKLRKTYADGAVYYADNRWCFPVTQDDTFALCDIAPAQVRVKFADGSVVGKYYGAVRVTESMSKEVL